MSMSCRNSISTSPLPTGVYRQRFCTWVRRTLSALRGMLLGAPMMSTVTALVFGSWLTCERITISRGEKGGGSPSFQSTVSDIVFELQGWMTLRSMQPGTWLRQLSSVEFSISPPTSWFSEYFARITALNCLLDEPGAFSE